MTKYSIVAVPSHAFTFNIREAVHKLRQLLSSSSDRLRMVLMMMVVVVVGIWVRIGCPESPPRQPCVRAFIVLLRLRRKDCAV